MGAAVPERSVTLRPEPASARTARRLVREVLTDAGRDEWVDAAELAVSELVTNAVLHAHTEVRVTVRCNAALRVEVADGDPTVPQPRHHGQEATTGRGMALVAALTDEHGVQPDDDGKVVWFVLRGGRTTEDEDEEALLAAWDDDAASWDVPAPVPTEPDGAVRVTLRAMPPTLWLAAVEHHDALLRELALVRAGAGADTGDLAQADRARTYIRTALLAELDEARKRGLARDPLPLGHPARLTPVPPQVDLQLLVPPDAAVDFATLQDVLDEGERLAADGRLLLRPALPEIVAVRDWAAEQVISQLHGGTPAPWHGAHAEVFTVDRDAVTTELDWDPSPVRDATRGAVAADEANRIVAISRPLADELGWDPAELAGRRVVVLVPARFREAHVAGFTRHLTTGEARALDVELELPVLRTDGSEVVCDFWIEAQRTASGRTVYTAWVTPKQPGD